MDDKNRRDIERNQKLQAGEIIIDDPNLKKAENFWFYNKWKIIIGAFIVLVLGVCIWQSCSKENYDATLMYAGPYEEINVKATFNGIQNAFNYVLPDDNDGNGEKSCDVIALIIYSDDQIQEIRDKAASDSKKVFINTELNTQELQKFDQLIIAGEYSVCLLDPTLYERVKKAGGFRKLSDVLGYTPQNAADEYSIRFKDTEFAKYYDVFKAMPIDTVLCLRTQSTFGGHRADASYDASEAFFKQIIEFVPDDQ